MPVKTPTLNFNRTSLSLVIEIVPEATSFSLWVKPADGQEGEMSLQTELFSPFPNTTSIAVALSSMDIIEELKPGRYVGVGMAMRQDEFSPEASVQFDLSEEEVETILKDDIIDAVLVPDKGAIQMPPPPQREAPTIIIPPAPTNPNPDPIRIPPTPKNPDPQPIKITPAEQPKLEPAKAENAPGHEEMLKEIREGFKAVSTSVTALATQVTNSTNATNTTLGQIVASTAQSVAASRQAADASRQAAEVNRQVVEANKQAAQAFGTAAQALQITNSRLGSIEGALSTLPADLARTLGQTQTNQNKPQRNNPVMNNESTLYKVGKWVGIAVLVLLLIGLTYWAYKYVYGDIGEKRTTHTRPPVAAAVVESNTVPPAEGKLSLGGTPTEMAQAVELLWQKMLSEENAKVKWLTEYTNQLNAAIIALRSNSVLVAEAKVTTTSIGSAAAAVTTERVAETNRRREIRQDVRVDNSTLGNGNVIGTVGDVFNINMAPDEHADALYYTNGWPADSKPSISMTVPNTNMPVGVAVEAPLVPDRTTELIVAQGYRIQPLGDAIPSVNVLVGDDWGHRRYDYRVQSHPWFMHGNMRIRMQYRGSSTMNYRFMIVPRGGPMGGPSARPGPGSGGHHR